MKSWEKPNSRDDSIFFSFCSTIALILTLGVFVSSLYGVGDAWAESSTKRAQEIESKIETWNDELR